MRHKILNKLEHISLTKIIEAVELLVDQPSIGRPGRIEGTRELVIEGTPFIVPYRQKMPVSKFFGFITSQDAGQTRCNN